MNILTIDTSSIVASVAIGDEQKLIAEYTINHKKTHSQKLLPMVDEMLKSCDLKAKDIDVFGVSLGPGSFTGLRIGITTAKVMAQALDKPVVGISTFEGLAYNVPYFGGLICPIIDAQRESVYSAIYSWKDNELLTLREADVLEINDLIDIIKDMNRQVIFLGDGVEKFKPIIDENIREISSFSTSNLMFPRAGAILDLVRKKYEHGLFNKAHEILPIYMRKSQAEVQYEARMMSCEG